MPEPAGAPAGERRAAERAVTLDKPARPQPPGAPHHPAPPSQQALERALAAREGAEAAVLLASGAGAMACALLALLRQGDHLVAGNAPAAATQEFLAHELPQLGVSVSFVPADESRAWRRALRPTTRLLFLELADADAAPQALLRAPRGLARETGMVLAVGVRGEGPAACRPLQEGADVVVRTVPAADEDGDAGVVCGSEALVDEVRHKAFRWGLTPGAALVAGTWARLRSHAPGDGAEGR